MNFNFTACPIGANYRLVDKRCYYYGDVKQSSYNQAETECAGKFPKGGRLFEPPTLEVNNLVLTASREVLTHASYYYIGVKRSGSDYKFASSGISVPFDQSKWTWISQSSVDVCVFAFKWLGWALDQCGDSYGTNHMVICESV